MLKFLVIAGLACAIGGAGYATRWRQCPDDPDLAMRAQMREAISSQTSATALSLAVLLMLEKGDIEKAKFMVAQQIAVYRRSWAKYDGVLGPKVLPMIEELAKRSQALQQEIERTSY